MHIDVNNAFLSWTAIDLLKKGYPKDIRNCYAIIGGDPKDRRGIVLAKSQPCKNIGIKTADTIYQAMKKCPNLLIFKSNFSLYKKMSTSLFNLLEKYTPDIEIASIDECYLDYGKVKKLYGDELQFAKKIKEEIKTTLGFTVNIGIANNKLCAKMASDFEKPDKIHTLYNNEIVTKMYPLPIENLYGIGKQTSKKLNELGIKTIKDLATYPIEKLQKIFKNQAVVIKEKAQGIDNEPVDSKEHLLKGIGNELTLEEDLSGFSNLSEYFSLLADVVSERLRKEKKYAKTITVTIKTSDFIKKSHQKTLVNPTNQSSVIYNYAKEIYLKAFNEETVRLVGIRLNQLTENDYYQYSIFEENKNYENQKLEKTLDELKEKYGNNIINKAINKQTREFKN